MIIHHDFTVRFVKSVLYELGAFSFVMMHGKEALNVLILMPLGVICFCKHGKNKLSRSKSGELCALRFFRLFFFYP